MKLHRKVLYPASFLRTVPVPASWDRRPLPNLIHKSLNSEKELTRLEKWYRCLRSNQKKDLKKRLHSLSHREFWGAYAELMVSRLAINFGAVTVRHAPQLWGKSPDFMVTFAVRRRQIWEVASGFQANEREHADDMAHELASWMNREFYNNNWKVIVDASNFLGNISFKKVKSIIQPWLKELGNGGSINLFIRPPKLNFDLNLWASPKAETVDQDSFVSGIMGQGGNLQANCRIKDILRRKIKKYPEVSKAKLPFVVFLFEGDWIQVSPFSLENALWGQQTINFSRNNPGNSSLGVQEGGLFLPGPDGRPQNTRLSAVVYCRRVYNNNNVHATLNVYHNPMALHPVDQNCFQGAAQCKTIVRETEIEISWDYQRDTRMLLLN